MTQLKPFRETMTEIGNIFGFHNIQLDELELQDVDAFDKKRMNAVLFLSNYSDETAIMLKFAKLYVQMQQALVHAINTNIGFLMESSPTPRVYSNLDKLVEYLAKYRVVVTDTETFLYRFNAIKPIELI